MTDSVVETVGLRKRFGNNLAVSDLTLTVRRGEVFGFLGPNGAGKTTSIKMLLGLARPTSGSGTVLGAPIGDIPTRAKIGFLPEHFRFHDWLTGREFLRFHGKLHRMPARELEARIDELLVRVDLHDAAERPLREYSKGMLQRAGLAQALLNRPDLVFLDEPTSGLDPLGRLLVRDIIADLRSEGTSVFLNSHILGEIEATCDRVVFIKRGSVVRQVVLAEQPERIEIELKLRSVTPEMAALSAEFGKDVRVRDGLIRLTVDSEDRLPELARRLIEHGADLFRLTTAKKSLETLFLEIMGDDERPG